MRRPDLRPSSNPGGLLRLRLCAQTRPRRRRGQIVQHRQTRNQHDVPENSHSPHRGRNAEMQTHALPLPQNSRDRHRYNEVTLKLLKIGTGIYSITNR